LLDDINIKIEMNWLKDFDRLFPILSWYKIKVMKIIEKNKKELKIRQIKKIK
jgi:hypothetical protein